MTTRTSRPLRVVVAALSALLALSLLGSCDKNEPADQGPGSGPQDEGG